MHPPYFQKSNTFTPLTKSRTSSCILELLSLVQHIYWHSNPPPLLYVSDFHSQAQSVTLTSSRLPEPGCCLSALSHWSHSGSASRWRCAAPGTRTGPWDTCLEGRRKQNTECTLWKGENSFTWKALTVRASETTCAEGISCLTARPVTLLRFTASAQLRNVYAGASDSVRIRFNVRGTGNWRGGRFLPANTMGLAGLNPGRASTGWSWR